jgi:hypothetical protein
VVLRHCAPSECQQVLDKVIKIYKTTSNLTTKLEAVESLAAVNDIKLVRNLLYKNFLESEFIKTQDLPQALNGLYAVLPGPSHRKVLDLKLAWLIENFDKLYEKCGMGLERIFRRCLDGHYGEESAMKIEDWARSDTSRANTIKIAACERAVKTAVENIRINNKWYERDHADLLKSLQNS